MPEYIPRRISAHRQHMAMLIVRKIQRVNEALLRCDIAYVLAAGDRESMDEGWPLHDVMIRDWPDCN
jgi:hypothetical protein